MRTVAQSTPMLLSDEAGHVRQVVLRHINATSAFDAPGLVEVVVLDEKGAELGVPYRLHMTNSGGRIAGDTPGVQDASFITDGGHITNG